MKKTYFGVEGDAEFDSADVSGSDSDCPEESEEVNEPRTTGVWGVVMGEKCSVVVAVVGSEDKHKVPMKNNYVAFILYASVWFSFKFSAVTLKIVKRVKNARC